MTWRHICRQTTCQIHPDGGVEPLSTQSSRLKDRGLGVQQAVRTLLLLHLAGLLLGGCEPGGTCSNPTEVSTDFDFTATVAERAVTVVTVEWSSELPCAGFVEYGGDGSSPWRTLPESELSTEHQAVLIGLRPDTTYPFRMGCVPEVCSTQLTSPEQVVTTGTLPDHLPTARTLPASNSTASAHYLTPLLTTATQPSSDANQTWVILLDPEGHVVWYAEVPIGFQSSGAHLSMDGKSIVFSLFPWDGVGQGGPNTAVRRVAWDGTVIQDLPVPGMHHDFTEVNGGSIAALTHESVQLGPEEWVSWGRIVEVSPEGEIEVLVDGADPETRAAMGLPLVTTSEPAPGGTFRDLPSGNFIRYVASEDAYYVSMGMGLGGVRGPMRFDRSTGEISWVMGGSASAFTYGDAGALPWLFIHGIDVTEEGVIVFANTTPEGKCTSVIEVGIDFDNMVVEPIWSYNRWPCTYIQALGNAERLANGNTVVFWSKMGLISEISPDGELLFEVEFANNEFANNFTNNYPIGYGTVIEDLHRF